MAILKDVQPVTIEEFYAQCLGQVLLGRVTLDDVEAAYLARLAALPQKRRDEEQARLRNAVGQTQTHSTRLLDRFLIAQRRVERLK